MPAYQQPIEHTIELDLIQCPGCFMHLALTIGAITELEDDGRTFWCPNGCAMHFDRGDDESKGVLRQGEAPSR